MTRSGLVGGLLVLLGAISNAQEGETLPVVEEKPVTEEPRIGMRFEGFLPGSINPTLEGTYTIDFKIYLSPQGGDAIWQETQAVEIRKGRMDIVLGLVQKIPMSIHEATFKFLGASVNKAREVYPRYPIVNVVYVSPKEALLASADKEEEGLAPRKPRTYDGAYSHAGVRVGIETAKPATWRDALAVARAKGGDLPDYQDWYRSLGACSEKDMLERSGHYEWVLPWVYDTASHGRYNRYFRGRFEGCDYMDLSPKQEYMYRVAMPLKQPE